MDNKLAMQNHPLNTSVFEIKSASIPDPGVGSNFSWTHPGRTRVQIIGVRFRITTGVGGATRSASLLISKGATPIIQAVAYNLVAAAKNFHLNFNSGQGCGSGATSLGHTAEPLPTDFYLNPDENLSSLVYGLQLVDTLPEITVRYKQWVAE